MTNSLFSYFAFECLKVSFTGCDPPALAAIEAQLEKHESTQSTLWQEDGTHALHSGFSTTSRLTKVSESSKEASKKLSGKASALFVTWFKTTSSGETVMCGCDGTFKPQDYAVRINYWALKA